MTMVGCTSVCNVWHVVLVVFFGMFTNSPDVQFIITMQILPNQQPFTVHS